MYFAYSNGLPSQYWPPLYPTPDPISPTFRSHRDKSHSTTIPCEALSDPCKARRSHCVHLLDCSELLYCCVLKGREKTKSGDCTNCGNTTEATTLQQFVKKKRRKTHTQCCDNNFLSYALCLYFFPIVNDIRAKSPLSFPFFCTEVYSPVLTGPRYSQKLLLLLFLFFFAFEK